ncbi:MAG: FecR domain-containing protein [Gemmatimonadaceae bacterium]|nr:FecR domain-containing protein [Gemmatimonadaceae bacterium]
MSTARIDRADPLAQLSEAARNEVRGEVDDAVHARGRERLVLAAARQRVLPKPRWGARAAFVVLAACLAGLALWLVPRASAPLSFVIEGASASADGEAVDARSEKAALRFSDGSRVVFARGSEGRVGELDARGARVQLAQGSVDLDIVHRDRTSWTVEAGPYRVHVTGTAFDVGWFPVGAGGSFEVRMREGTVVVEGPLVPQGMPLTAGQVLQVDGSGLRVGPATELEPLAVREATPPEGERTAAPVAAAPPPEKAAVSPPPASASSRAETWTGRVARGDYASVVSEAESRGLDATLDSAPLADLVALADSARYEKKPAIARRALEAQRKRFPTSQAGQTATFLLGRLAEDSDGDLRRAIALYDAYLAHGGPFAAEALGRKMMAVERSSGRAAAKPVAEAYLERHPEGSYAKVAREIANE